MRRGIPIFRKYLNLIFVINTTEIYDEWVNFFSNHSQNAVVYPFIVKKIVYSNRAYCLSCKESDNMAIAIQTKSTCCDKSVRIPSFCGPYFSAFGVNTETYGVSLHIQSECGKIWTRKTPNTESFNAYYSFCWHTLRRI